MVSVPELNGNGVVHSQFRADRMAPPSVVEQSALSQLAIVPEPPVIVEIPLTSPLHNPNARLQLERFGTAPSIVNRLYDSEGRFIYTTPDDIDFDSMTIEGLSYELQQRTKPVYDAVDTRLREDKPENGFNKHNLENHVMKVASVADTIVKWGGYSDRVRMLTALAAYGHDIGNINSRVDHASDSAILYPHILPSLTRSESDMNIVLEAVRYHDEKTVVSAMRHLQTADERMFRVLEMGDETGVELPVVLAALVLADKADIGRDRINEAAINMEAVSTDPHVWTYLCARNEGFTYDRNARELVLRIAFDPRLAGEDLERFEPVSRERSNHEGYRVNNPKHIHEVYKNGIPVFYQWAATLKRIHEQRFTLMAEMAQIALPVRRFRLELVDQLSVADRSNVQSVESDGVKVDAEVITQPFEPQYLDPLFEHNATKFAKKDSRLKRYSTLYASGK